MNTRPLLVACSLFGSLLVAGCGADSSLEAKSAHDQGKGTKHVYDVTYDQAWAAAHVAINWNGVGTPTEHPDEHYLLTSPVHFDQIGIWVTSQGPTSTLVNVVVIDDPNLPGPNEESVQKDIAQALMQIAAGKPVEQAPLTPVAKPLRFLHTADWQLGLKLAFVAGDAGAVARFQRFEVVRRLAELAKDRAVDAVVVAGDVFDDNAVGEDSLQRARDALAPFAPIPVLLLPGNHDAATPDCVLRRLRAGDHVHSLLDDEPFVLPHARFHPCPLRRRHERDDPSRALPKRAPGDPILVAIAHGALIDFTEGLESKNVIDWRRVIASGYDYLALGDWHGTLSFDPRVWYSGAPEPTRFKEKRPGYALVVDIDASGATPRVEEIPVARTRWTEQRFDLASDESVGEVERFFASVDEPSMTLVSAHLAGHVSLGARARLEAALTQARGSLMHLRVDDDDLHDRPSEEDLRTLAVDGFVGRAVEALRANGTGAAEDALRLLHRFVVEERR